MAAPWLRIRHLGKSFGRFQALRDVSLDIGQGSFVCFLGPSGCGKTTLLRAIAGLDPQTSGHIHQAGEDISGLPPGKRDFGIVFQSYALFPNLTARDNIAFGLENMRRGRAEIAARVTELLALVGLPGLGGQYPAQLSGGQQQRIALARAIATSPGLLLLDEPLSALDARVRVHLRHEIRKLQRQLGVTTIMVTHDQEEALVMADRIVVMNHGRIEQEGTPTGIYRDPATLFVAGFIGEMNRIPAVAGPDRAVIGGRPFAARNRGVTAGARAVAAIRPEDIVPAERSDGNRPDDNRRDNRGSNLIDADIADMAFLGSFWRAQLRSEALHGAVLTTDFSVNAVRRLGLAPGGRITVALPADRLLLFADAAMPDGAA